LLALASKRKTDGGARSLEHASPLGEMHMPYTADIARSNPTAFVFVVDQSASMDEKLDTGQSKAQFVADVLNKTLYQLVIRCTRAEDDGPLEQEITLMSV
jgi:hypothetical protein